MFQALPDKLNPVIKPLMESVKYEPEEVLQQISAKRLAILLDYCRSRNPCPNEKILTNLCTFLRCDPEYTPQVFPNQEESAIENELWRHENYNGVLTLINQQKTAEKVAFKRSNSSGRGPGEEIVIIIERNICKVRIYAFFVCFIQFHQNCIYLINVFHIVAFCYFFKNK